jgi:hypothetical protein
MCGTKSGLMLKTLMSTKKNRHRGYCGVCLRRNHWDVIPKFTAVWIPATLSWTRSTYSKSKGKIAPVAKHHTIKMCRGVEVKLQEYLTLAIKWGEWSVSKCLLKLHLWLPFLQFLARVAGHQVLSLEFGQTDSNSMQI